VSSIRGLSPRARSVVLARSEQQAPPRLSHSDELSKSVPQRAHVSVQRRGAVSAASSRTRRARSTSVPGAGFEPAFLSSELSVLPTRRSRNRSVKAAPIRRVSRSTGLAPAGPLSETKLDVFHRYLPPNASKATESSPGGLRWHTWSSSRCYEKPELMTRSSVSRGGGHTGPDRQTPYEPEPHVTEPKLDIRCIGSWTYCG